jgi:AcrR family transcriptional regulator
MILHAAAELFAEAGYESATTNAIAARAEISIGSLYQYFPDKDAILQALADRYLEQLRMLYDGIVTEDVVYLPLPVLIDRLVDSFADFHLACPACKHILLGSDVSADIAAASAEMEQETTERFKRLLQLKAADMDDNQARLLAMVCKAVAKAMLPLLAAAADGESQAQVRAELKRLLLAYLGPIIGGD